MAKPGLDKKSFEVLFRTHFTPLCAFANKFLQDFDESKEIVHDVFVKIWDKREEVDLDKSIKTYLYTAVRNRCFNFKRDQSKFVVGGAQDSLLEKTDDLDETKLLEAAELEGKIATVISNLPEGCRRVFVLNRFEGLKYQEVADKLNISIKTVETQMSKALKVLKEALKDYIIALILYFNNFW